MARYGLIRAPFPRRILCPQRRWREGGGWCVGVEVCVCAVGAVLEAGREGRQTAVGVQRAEAQAG